MRTLSIAALAALCVTTVHADDWTAARLRGGVFVLESGQWVQLQRGSVISDDSVIKSAPGSRASFVRGAETVEIGEDTTIQIADGRSGFTTVYNHEGTVGIAAEVRNVQHFAVQTHYLAAVVKGTAFTVRAGADSATVAVARGSVEVNDQRYSSTVSLSAGQEVSTSRAAPITTSDIMPVSGDMPPPPPPADELPTVFNEDDRVPAGRADAPGQGGGAPGKSGNAPGPGGGSPGNSGNAPGHAGGPPGNSGNAPGHGGSSPGNSGNAPGHGGGSPGNSGNAPGHGGGSPGNSGNAPGHGGGSSGNSGNAPGHGGGTPGNSGNAPGHSGDSPGNSGNGPGKNRNK